MINNLKKFFKNQKVLILGFGREGISTYHFLRTNFPEQELFIADQNEELLSRNPELEKDENLTLILGNQYLDHLEEFDIIMKTPGISFAGMDTSDFIDKITSQLELLLRFTESKTIGITGTKGKSTTSSLVYEILQDQGKKSLLLGNIGNPVFEYLSEITPETILVLEMSSHQLEFMAHSPNIAVITNLYPEHLDHYNDFHEYAVAKAEIYLHQTSSDVFFYNEDSEKLRELIATLPKSKAKAFRISQKSTSAEIYRKDNVIFFNDVSIYSTTSERNLIGDYNIYNIMFALGVAKVLDLDIERAGVTINNFKPLRHRLELVGEINGAKYYDNSIATIPEAVMSSIEAFDGMVETLIIGGMDRGLDYSDFITFLKNSNIKNIICMPKTGHDIAKKLPEGKYYIVESLEEAVGLAKELTTPGHVCLLAPAAASYGFFRNFEEKGELFKELVLK